MATKDTAPEPKVTAEVTPKVVVKEQPKAPEPGLSATTLAEMEAGRKALAAQNK